MDKSHAVALSLSSSPSGNLRISYHYSYTGDDGENVNVKKQMELEGEVRTDQPWEWLHDALCCAVTGGIMSGGWIPWGQPFPTREEAQDEGH